MANQVLRAINHMKYVCKKKPSTIKIFNYLQNNGASNYNYESSENEIADLRNKGIIDETFKFTNPIEEVLNFPEDDVDITSENSDISCLNTQSSQADEENDATPPLNNNTLAPNPQAVFPSDFDILFQSLDGKLNGKVSAIKSYLLDEVYDLKNELKVLQDNYLTENSESNEKEEICALKQKVKFLEVENKFLINDVVSKQNLTDPLLEHNSNLLSHQCCRVIQDTQSNVRSGISTDVTDNHSNNHGVNTFTNEKTNKQTTFYKKNNKTTVHKDSDDGNLIKRQSTNSSTVKKEVSVIGDSMIKYVNGREVSRNDSVKVRSHPGATTDDFIDYVRPTVRKKPNLTVIHCGTNDIQNNVNTLQKIRKVISSLKEYDTDGTIKIALSSIIHRSDHDFEDNINETNRKLENLFKGNSRGSQVKSLQ